MSPEVCQNQPYTNKSDVWSLGCVIYELCMLKYAFSAENLLSLVYQIVKGAMPAVDPTRYSRNLCDTVALLLTREDVKRPTCRAVMEFPFLQAHISILNANGGPTFRTRRQREATPRRATQTPSGLASAGPSGQDMDEAPLTTRERIAKKREKEAEGRALELKVAAITNAREKELAKERYQNEFHKSTSSGQGAGRPPGPVIPWPPQIEQPPPSPRFGFDPNEAAYNPPSTSSPGNSRGYYGETGGMGGLASPTRGQQQPQQPLPPSSAAAAAARRKSYQDDPFYGPVVASGTAGPPPGSAGTPRAPFSRHEDMPASAIARAALRGRTPPTPSTAGLGEDRAPRPPSRPSSREVPRAPSPRMQQLQVGSPRGGPAAEVVASSRLTALSRGAMKLQVPGDDEDGGVMFGTMRASPGADPGSGGLRPLLRGSSNLPPVALPPPSTSRAHTAANNARGPVVYDAKAALNHRTNSAPASKYGQGWSYSGPIGNPTVGDTPRGAVHTSGFPSPETPISASFRSGGPQPPPAQTPSVFRSPAPLPRPPSQAALSQGVEAYEGGMMTTTVFLRPPSQNNLLGLQMDRETGEFGSGRPESGRPESGREREGSITGLMGRRSLAGNAQQVPTPTARARIILPPHPLNGSFTQQQPQPPLNLNPLTRAPTPPPPSNGAAGGAVIDGPYRTASGTQWRDADPFKPMPPPGPAPPPGSGASPRRTISPAPRPPGPLPPPLRRSFNSSSPAPQQQDPPGLVEEDSELVNFGTIGPASATAQSFQQAARIIARPQRASNSPSPPTANPKETNVLRSSANPLVAVAKPATVPLRTPALRPKGHRPAIGVHVQMPASLMGEDPLGLVEHLPAGAADYYSAADESAYEVHEATEVIDEDFRYS